MTTEPLVPVRVRDAGGRAAWAEGLTVSLPSGWMEASGLAARIDGAGALRFPADLPGVPPQLADALRERALWTLRKPGSSRLPFSYQLIPPRMRALFAGAVGRWKRRQSDRWAAFPRWPLDLSADFAADLAGGSGPFPERKTPVLLSHDLDSPEGLANAVKRFLPLEEKWGASSSNYFVPHAWPLDHGLLAEIAARGHELGIHGHDHGNKTPFLDEIALRQRLEASRPLLERYAIKGYRAPSLLRTPALLRGLKDLYAYDSSIPASGGLFPVPNNGCASARPFRIDGLPELPVSLPRDGSLRFLGHRLPEILELWISCAETIARSGGVVVLLTHCEERFSGNGPMLEIYARFLEYVAGDSRYAWSTPLSVLDGLGLLR
jgi:peptidoglycan/xylan/chitin deacetylase (PgdA/CDA1 family)